MKTLRMAGSLLAAAVLSLAAALPASAAHHRVPAALAAQETTRSAPHLPMTLPSGGDEWICLTNSTAYCWQMNGGGTQATITNIVSNYANMTPVNSYNVDGVNYSEFQDANGKCVYEATSSALNTSTGGCVANQDNEVFYEIPNSGATGAKLVNLGTGDKIMTFNDANEKPIWANGESGWATWSGCPDTAPAC